MSIKSRISVPVFALLLLVSCSASGLDNDEATAITNLLALDPGQRVADVGAGDGEWTEILALEVGEEGRVWATEVKEDLVEELGQRMAEEGLRQVDVVLGDQDSLGLPAACCEAVLLRLVYHHFEDPEKMRQELLRALVSGGKLLVIDIEPQEHWPELDDVPDRGGHGIPLANLVSELEAAGFAEVERQIPWNDDEDRYAVLFTAP